ncbi:MAG: DUF805 domain-containing protein [Mesorhizobium sp.]|nr:DUF805 domain-containing protein [Mesorhizobium sp.]MBL8577497.1 DUF805 domain-containing protein [Mesorhizobium sp.]
MRGEVLHYDEAQGFGFITGQDGNRYTFRREDMRRVFPAARGTAVEFRENGTQARDVFQAGSADVGAAPEPRVRSSSVPSVAVTPAATVATPSVAPQHFGRNAVDDDAPVLQATPSMGLWAYFWNSMTTDYATFRGRARRKEYWAFVLFWTLALIVLSFVGLMIDALLGNFDPYGNGPVAILVVAGLAVAVGFLPGIAVTVRRFHDVGMSGWFYLLFVVLSLFTIGSLIIFVVTLIPSQKRDNKWGPVPEGVTIPPPYTGT